MIKLNAREKATRCTRREAALLKCDLATNGDARMLQLRAVALKLFIRVLLSRSGILHDAQSKHCANYSPVSHWSPDLDNSCHEFSTLLPPQDRLILPQVCAITSQRSPSTGCPYQDVAREE